MAQTLVVIDTPGQLDGCGLDEHILTFEQYLEQYPRKGERGVQLLNLCDTAHYLSRGYYCSLLAEARGHRVLPSVNTINDLRSKPLYRLQLGNESAPPRSPVATEEAPSRKSATFHLHLGHCDDPAHAELAARIFARFPAPLLKVTVQWKDGWVVRAVERLALADLGKAQRAAFLQALEGFAANTWRRPRARKRSRWDMALLVDPAEKLPPSNAGALQRMVKAAAKVGIEARFIGAADYLRLGEFDALFIRETTAIDHHTYRFARKAELEGMVVVDDPASILRCCNKVFLHDAFTYNGVPSLKTLTVPGCGEEDLARLEEAFAYPMVVKVPESSFSRGVFRVEDREALATRLQELLTTSALALVQEYRYTEYDWRIGILNHRPLYACRYYMAPKHWQIYHHGSRRNTGGFDALPTFEVPRPVLQAAIQASHAVGDGLYGVDVKQHGKEAFVLEVNDNPNIDHGVEDAHLGDELYMLLMSEMERRLEQRGR